MKLNKICFILMVVLLVFVGVGISGCVVVLVYCYYGGVYVVEFVVVVGFGIWVDGYWGWEGGCCCWYEGYYECCDGYYCGC